MATEKKFVSLDGLEHFKDKLMEKIPDDIQSTAITDAGGYFTTKTVEGALQQIGSELNGLLASLSAI